MANEVSEETKYECKFYDSIDQWWHQTIIVIKHVTTIVNEYSDQPTTPEHKGKKKKNTNFLNNEPTS